MNYLPELSLSICIVIVAVNGYPLSCKSGGFICPQFGWYRANKYASLHLCRGVFLFLGKLLFKEIFALADDTVLQKNQLDGDIIFHCVIHH